MKKIIEILGLIIAIIHLLLVAIPVAILLYVFTTPILLIQKFTKWLKKNCQMKEF
jgi:hypothetical protein